ncbi:cell division protein FtsL [Lentibacter sp. XHP0401]|jgi:cell division protein FtsL|uniref:cell division protein FtsL n=1 Tax=Lentibacter sp. XHP0401 TaxID=2984334 RepID=UPI0021E8CEDD|nr:cell division protein FtsL [Lentibacter sp. XHP0401]MCV2893316.1 cell division protein FtsL [Lentibacter sp. XHP0401]
MRTIVYLLTAICVIGSAFWAYHENYQTQEAYGNSRKLQGEIGEARARLAILRAEWAYQNRPDRLHELAELNFEKIGLLPLSPEHFGAIDEVNYPVTVEDELELEFDLDGSVEVSSDGIEQNGADQ